MPPPLYDDENGTLFIDVYSLPGAWKEVLPYCMNIKQTGTDNLLNQRGNEDEIPNAGTDARRTAQDNQGG
jgi:hypothetical protein